MQHALINDQFALKQANNLFASLKRHGRIRRFIWDRQMSTKRFLSLVVRSAKQQYENTAAERDSIQGR